MQASEFLRRLPRRNPRLFAMICRFNNALAIDIHSSRIPGHTLESWQHIAASRRGVSKLSELLTAQIEAEGAAPQFYDFIAVHRRLALLSVRQIDRLARYTTAALNHQQISHAVTRAQRDDAKAAVGEDGYQFAVRKAGQLLGSRIAKCNEAYEGSLSKPFDCIIQCFAGESPAFQRRLQMKFPAGVDLSTSPAGEATDVLAETMIRILLHEIAPELKPCFN